MVNSENLAPICFYSNNYRKLHLEQNVVGIITSVEYISIRDYSYFVGLRASRPCVMARPAWVVLGTIKGYASGCRGSVWWGIFRASLVASFSNWSCALL